MGIYLNKNNTDFQESLNSEIYIDKTELIKHTNKVLCTKQKYVCISRPRRFGKSMTAEMLTAYYSRGCDSREMFSKYKIAKAESFEKHLNKYNVIHINIVDFINRADTMSGVIEYISRRILHELKREFGDVDCFDWNDLTSVLDEIFQEKKVPFIFIIDEWDCVFRKKKYDSDAQTEYLDFLRNLLKDKSYIALAYMTGILPIKKYGEHSALNMFTEISMTDPREYAEFTGFTENEVKELCEKYSMPFDETKRWYDGYNLMETSIYNPRSVVMSMTGGYFNNYWTSTETYEALKKYIVMDIDGLKEKVSAMIAGEKIGINTLKFQNDMVSVSSADDILTLLVHLGYLTYSQSVGGLGEVWIPNNEVQQEFINSISDGGWENLMKAINSSAELLKATLKGNADKVAEMVSECHNENTSVLKYNDENSLACVVTIAYYSARKDYIVHREFPTGEGFADIVFIPRKNVELPAMIIELKKGHSADEAVEQIKNRKYSSKISEYTGEILLVGINYDSKKGHSCVIEKIRQQ